MKILTYLTDFGTKSSYVAQMKGIALSITDANIIDISHDVTPHNIREGAFVLKSSVPYFPVGTIHIGVVDPGVGGKRKGIVVVTNTHVLVGPDNGLLIPCAEELGEYTVYEIKNPNVMLKNVSNTFHGRDVFTPVAAHILNGIYFEEIGPVVKDYIKLDFGVPEITEKTVTGKIIYKDGFGNIITNIEFDKIKKSLVYNKKIMMFIGKKRVQVPFVKTYSEVKAGEMLATIGSNNYLEISMNQGNAFEKLGIKVDDDIKILIA